MQITIIKLNTALNSRRSEYIDRLQVRDRNLGVPLTVCLAPDWCSLIFSVCPPDCPFTGGGTCWFESFLMKERSGSESSPALRGGGGSRAVGRSCCLSSASNKGCHPCAFWTLILQTCPEHTCGLDASQFPMADLAVAQLSNCMVVAGKGGSWHVHTQLEQLEFCWYVSLYIRYPSLFVN